MKCNKAQYMQNANTYTYVKWRMKDFPLRNVVFLQSTFGRKRRRLAVGKLQDFFSQLVSLPVSISLNFPVRPPHPTHQQVAWWLVTFWRECVGGGALDDSSLKTPRNFFVLHSVADLCSCFKQEENVWLPRYCKHDTWFLLNVEPSFKFPAIDFIQLKSLFLRWDWFPSQSISNPLSMKLKSNRAWV